MNKYFAGIGSRETPKEILSIMTKLAEFLTSMGYILRSGAADGADKAFEAGVTDVDHKEIYLPWAWFNDHPSLLYHVSDEAYDLAKRYHPAWDRLSLAGKKLIARDGYQLLGKDLKTPSEFLVCWTRRGQIVGGTGQVIRIARDLKIPVYNLFFDDDVNEILRWMTTRKVCHGYRYQ